MLTSCRTSTGYKVGTKKTAEELAALDAEDESLAKWKASLGIVAPSDGSAPVPASGPQVSFHLIPQLRGLEIASHGLYVDVTRVLKRHFTSRSRCCPSSSNRPL